MFTCILDVLASSKLVGYGWYKLTVSCCDFSGAATTNFTSYNFLREVETQSIPRKCVNIYCQGYETSLAECIIYDKKRIGRRRLATVTCYEGFQAPKGWINYQLFLKLFVILHYEILPRSLR